MGPGVHPAGAGRRRLAEGLPAAGLPLLLGAGCGRVDFNPAAYDDRCWAPGRCVAVMNLEPEVDAWLDQTDLPVEGDELRRWRAEVESVDGTFDFVGASRLGRRETLDHLGYLVRHQRLVLDLFAPLEEELLLQAPFVLDRNDDATLARVRVGIAPYLQQTNGSVAVVNGGDHVLLLLGVDRLAYNILERGRSETWARAVVAHELVHVSHFATSAYATEHRDDPAMQRSLWVEGLAVWGSAHAGAVPYGLDEVFGEPYAEACRADGARWAGDYLAQLDDEGAAPRWWEDSGRPPARYGVITPGYCVAYLTVAALAADHSFDELLSWPPSRAYPAARGALREVSRGG